MILEGMRCCLRKLELGFWTYVLICLLGPIGPNVVSRSQTPRSIFLFEISWFYCVHFMLLEKMRSCLWKLEPGFWTYAVVKTRKNQLVGFFTILRKWSCSNHYDQLGIWGVLWTPQQVQGRALVGFGAKPQKYFGIFIVFPHENVLNKNQFERNKSCKYTLSSQWSRLLLDIQQ